MSYFRHVKSHISVMLVLGCLSHLAQAVQPEPFVSCDEGVIPEPMIIHYGEHTVDCAIGNIADMDRFQFQGRQGDYVRFVVSETNWEIEPHLEVFDPDGDRIVDSYGAYHVLIDKLLEKSGNYTIITSDNNVDETGGYILQLERIRPSNTSLIAFDAQMSDGINHLSDIDFFVFTGTEGDIIRFILSEIDWEIEPHLEVFDPDGDRIVDSYGAYHVLIDKLLEKSGNYTVIASDSGVDDSGGYDMEIQCIHGNCGGSFLTPKFIDSTSIDDQNNNGHSEVAVLQTNSVGRGIVQIKDSSTDRLIKTIGFSGKDWTPVSVSMGYAANDDSLIGVLEQKTTGQIRVRVRDVTAKNDLSNIKFLNKAWTPVSVGFDYGATGDPLISVLATNRGTGRTIVEVRDAMTGEQINNIRY